MWWVLRVQWTLGTGFCVLRNPLPLTLGLLALVSHGLSALVSVYYDRNFQNFVHKLLGMWTLGTKLCKLS